MLSAVKDVETTLGKLFKVLLSFHVSVSCAIRVISKSSYCRTSCNMKQLQSAVCTIQVKQCILNSVDRLVVARTSQPVINYPKGGMYFWKEFNEAFYILLYLLMGVLCSVFQIHFLLCGIFREVFSN